MKTVAFVLLVVGGLNADDVPLTVKLLTGQAPMPDGRRVVNRNAVGPTVAAQLGRKLGGEATNLTSVMLERCGKTIQINIVECPTPEAA